MFVSQPAVLIDITDKNEPVDSGNVPSRFPVLNRILQRVGLASIVANARATTMTCMNSVGDWQQQPLAGQYLVTAVSQVTTGYRDGDRQRVRVTLCDDW